MMESNPNSGEEALEENPDKKTSPQQKKDMRLEENFDYLIKLRVNFVKLLLNGPDLCFSTG